MAKLITRTFESNVYAVIGVDMSLDAPEIVTTAITADTEKDARKAFKSLYKSEPASVKFERKETAMYGITPELFKAHGVLLNPDTRKPYGMEDVEE